MPLNESQIFLRWVGGKRRLVHRFSRLVPDAFRDKVYHEPFVGAASLFLRLRPPKAYLSDSNKDLINAYRFVQNQPALLARYLAIHAQNNSESYYYEVRAKYNRAVTYSCAQAARFIYLNRTCFNGIFRVNEQGEFNVPRGRILNPLFPSLRHLKNVSEAMRNTQLTAAPFAKSMAKAKRGHFVYLDPPYPPLNGTSYFQHYTKERFDEATQHQLFKEFVKLHNRGCLLMMSNADTPLIRELYRDFEITELPVTRFVSSKKMKLAVSELVITNYEVTTSTAAGW